MGDRSGKLPAPGGQENHNSEKESVNWDEFDFSFLNSDDKSDKTSEYGPSKADGSSEDVMRMSFPHSPGDLKTVMPEKPSIMEALTNFQSGKINKSLYLDQLKIYADGQIQIFADRVEKTVEAHQNLSQAALENIREKIKLWGKEIMAATDLSMQETVSQGVLRASEIANKAMTELAKMNAPQIIVKPAMKGVIDQMQKTISNIQHREVGISKSGKMEWDRQ